MKTLLIIWLSISLLYSFAYVIYWRLVDESDRKLKIAIAAIFLWPITFPFHLIRKLRENR